MTVTTTISAAEMSAPWVTALLLTALIVTTPMSYADNQGLAMTKSTNAVAEQDIITEQLTEDTLQSLVWQEVGRVRFSVLFWKVYDSRLLTLTGDYDENSYPKQLEITYLRDIDKQDLVDNTEKQWQHLNYSAEQYREYLPWLSEVWPDIKKGQQLSIVVDQDTSQFYFNGQAIGQPRSRTFGDMFLAIWLSPNTSEPKLRTELIGQSKRAGTSTSVNNRGASE